MKNYKYILFDLDDTLIDNRQNIKYSFTKVCQKLGVKYSYKLFEKWFAFDKNYWRRFSENKIKVPNRFSEPQPKFIKYVRGLRFCLFFNIKLELAIKINEYYISCLNENVIAIDGAKEVLEYLSKKYTLVIATNGPTLAALPKLEKIGCSSFITKIFSSDQTINKVAKSNKLYFDELKEVLKVKDSDDMIIIGDEIKYDIMGGMSAGIDTCWFNRKNAQVPQNIHPTFVINNLREIKNVF